MHEAPTAHPGHSPARILRIVGVAVLAALFLWIPASGASRVHAATTPGSAATAPPTVVASGLTYPRGLGVGPDGSVYAAIAGTGTYTHPSGPCGQGPFGGAPT
ncbi:MAG TPA: hypothetical protein VF221_09415, partial [Chloroflexota bacterium]